MTAKISKPRTIRVAATSSKPGTIRVEATSSIPGTIRVEATSSEEGTIRIVATSFEPSTSRIAGAGSKSSTAVTGSKPSTSKIAIAGSKPSTSRIAIAGSKPSTSRIGIAGSKRSTSRIGIAGSKPRTSRIAVAGSKPRTSRIAVASSRPGTSRIAAAAACSRLGTSRIAAAAACSRLGTSRIAAAAACSRPGTSRMAAAAAGSRPGTSRMAAAAAGSRPGTSIMAAAAAGSRPGTSRMAAAAAGSRPGTSRMAAAAAGSRPSTSRMATAISRPSTSRTAGSRPSTSRIAALNKPQLRLSTIDRIPTEEALKEKLKMTKVKFLSTLGKLNSYSEKEKLFHYYPAKINTLAGPKAIILPEADGFTVHDLFFSGLVHVIYSDRKTYLKQFEHFPGPFKFALRKFVEIRAKTSQFIVKVFSTYPRFEGGELSIPSLILCQMGLSHGMYRPIPPAPGHDLTDEALDTCFTENYLHLCKKLQLVRSDGFVNYESENLMVVSSSRYNMRMPEDHEVALQAFEKRIIDLISFPEGGRDEQIGANLCRLLQSVRRHRCRFCKKPTETDEQQPKRRKLQ